MSPVSTRELVPCWIPNEFAKITISRNKTKKKAKKNTAYSLAKNIAICALLKTHSGIQNFADVIIDFSEKEYIYSNQIKDEFLIEKELLDGKEPNYIDCWGKPNDEN